MGLVITPWEGVGGRTRSPAQGCGVSASPRGLDPPSPLVGTDRVFPRTLSRKRGEGAGWEGVLGLLGGGRWVLGSWGEVGSPDSVK